MHAIDQIVTGTKQTWSGDVESDYTYTAAKEITGSENFASGLDLGLGLSSVGLAGSNYWNSAAQSEWSFFSKANHIGYQNEEVSEYLVYRAFTKEDLENFRSGSSLQAKAPQGNWTASEHVANYSEKYPGTAKDNSPWISTTRNESVAKGYDSGHGIAEIDTRKIPNEQVEVWKKAPRANGKEGLPYHRSIWAEELTIHKEIPHESINKVNLVKK